MERPRDRDPRPRIKYDMFDAALAANRQRIIIEMMLRGQISGGDGIALYADTTSPETVRREREATDAGRLGEYDTPSGHLATLLFKLRPGIHEVDHPGEARTTKPETSDSNSNNP